MTSPHLVWCDVMALVQPTPEEHDVESVAWTLLRRWGVVFRKLLDREGDLPAWYELLRVYRRLEAQGRIRGGRFVAGFAGEQYALPEAVTRSSWPPGYPKIERWSAKVESGTATTCCGCGERAPTRFWSARL